MNILTAKKPQTPPPNMSLIIVPRIFPNPQLDLLLQTTKHITTNYEIVIVTSNTKQPETNQNYANNLLTINPKLSKATIAILDTDPGLAAGRNIGATLTNSNNMVFCDDDTALIQDITPLLNYLKNGYQSVQPLVLRWADSNIIDSAGDQIIRKRGIYHALIRGTDQNLKQIGVELTPQQVPSLRGAFMAIRKDAWAAIGGFDESFGFDFDDVDIGWRMTLAGYKNMFTPSVRVLHRGGKTTNPTTPDTKLTRFHIVNHHALQLKTASYTAWPFILARFYFFTAKHALRHRSSIEETWQLHTMLTKRLPYARAHRRILKNRFHYAGKNTFNAMTKQTTLREYSSKPAISSFQPPLSTKRNRISQNAQ